MPDVDCRRRTADGRPNVYNAIGRAASGVGGRPFHSTVEHYAWVLILFGWSLLLLIGLGGSDLLAAARPGTGTPEVPLPRWLRRAIMAVGPGSASVPPPLVRQPGRSATESGFHPAV